MPGGGFACSKTDLSRSWAPSTAGLSDRFRQEAEANRFAIELLAPVSAFAPLLDEMPNLAHVVRLAARLDISRMACARRYAELHRWPLAVVFSQEGHVSFAERNTRFPNVAPGRGRRLPRLDAASPPYYRARP